MGTQCVDRRCLKECDSCRSTPRPFDRRMRTRTPHCCRPSRFLPAFSGVPMTPVSADSHVDGRVFWPARSRSIRAIRITRRTPRRPRTFPSSRQVLPCPVRKPRYGRRPRLSTQKPRSHSTTSLRNAAGRRQTLRPATVRCRCCLPRPSVRTLPTHQGLTPVTPTPHARGIEAPIHSNEPAVWQPKPKLRSLRGTLVSRVGELSDTEAPVPLADSASRWPRRTFRSSLADLMQPRDSVASRNSAVRHADYDRLTPTRLSIRIDPQIMHIPNPQCGKRVRVETAPDQKARP